MSMAGMAWDSEWCATGEMKQITYELLDSKWFFLSQNLNLSFGTKMVCVRVDYFCKCFSAGENKLKC